MLWVYILPQIIQWLSQMIFLEKKKKKKKSLIFIYKDMTLTLKLLSQISDSTKMSLLLAIRHPAIRVRIVAPHTRLRVET